MAVLYNLVAWILVFIDQASLIYAFGIGTKMNAILFLLCLACLIKPKAIIPCLKE